MTQSPSPQAQEIPSRYVAFCDVLGFSYAIENHFDVTLEVYQEFRALMRDWPFPEQAQVSVYSDSIIVVCAELAPLLYAVQQLWFAALSSDWLIRGGIAYGKHWECKEDGNLFVVSEALTRAAKIGSTIRHPAIVISPEVELTLAHWVTRFAHDVFTTPLLHFRGLNIVNPFNPFWFASTQMRICRLMSNFPQHTEKYQWFLDLFDEVQRNQLLVPESVVKELLELGIIQPIHSDQSLVTP
jgi:hypothetical protein